MADADSRGLPIALVVIGVVISFVLVPAAVLAVTVLEVADPDMLVLGALTMLPGVLMGGAAMLVMQGS